MNRRLSILCIGHSYTLAVGRALAREVARDPNIEITVAAPTFFHGDMQTHSLESEPPESGIRLIGLKASATSLIHIFRYDESGLRRLIGDGGFDVVHAWEEPYIYAGYQISRVLKDAGSSFCFRTAQNRVKWYPPPFAGFEKQTLARAQGWIAGGHLVYQAMVKRGYQAERGRVLTLAVDTDAFKPLTPAVRAEVLNELGLTPPVIGFCGRLTAAKGVDVLMQAMELVKSPKSWSLLWLGDGPSREKILKWAERHGWADRVKIKLADHDQVPRYLGVADLMVAPSQTTRNWEEQFGRMLVEAFACGVPVIASTSGEIPYVVGQAGQIVDEHDVPAWARAIEALLGDAQARAELVKLGLERVNLYSAKALSEKYREYYYWLAEQQRS